MSVAKLRQLLRESAADEQITLAEVRSLIAAARDEGSFTPGERLVLEAALEAHQQRFEAEALVELRRFLSGSG